MNDPKQKPEPQRVSKPDEIPGQNPPMEAPEKNVPHDPDRPMAMTGSKGEGSYEGTQQYREGYEKFAKKTSPEDAQKKASEINPDDPALKKAADRAKTGGRVSAPSIH